MKYTVKIADQSYEVEIEDLNKRPVIARIGDDVFEVSPENNAVAALEAPSRELAPKAATKATVSPVAAPAVGGTTSGKSILSPLPGTVVEIHVKAGDDVKAGQAVITIEAMKMKNVIRATGPGKIKQVLVATGQSTQHRQVLVEFE